MIFILNKFPSTMMRIVYMLLYVFGCCFMLYAFSRMFDADNDDYNYLNDDATQMLGFYSLVYILLAWCVVLPPMEFVSAGLTLDTIFSPLLGQGEQLNFIDYHMRRTLLNIFCHSLIPLVYFVVVDCMHPSFNMYSPSHIRELPALWQLAFAASFVPILIATAVVIYWSKNNFENHPIAKTLRKFDLTGNWQQVATAINTEYRRFDKFAVNLGGIRRLIVTDSWIVYVSTYSLQLAQQQDVDVIVIASDEHVVSHHTTTHEHDAVQFLNIQIKSASRNREQPIGDSFVIRLNARDYRDLRAKLHARVTVARDVIIQSTTSDRFVLAFADVVEQNGTIELDASVVELLDACLGCSTTMSNVKLQKCCDNSVQRPLVGDQQLPDCVQCYCRPMWYGALVEPLRIIQSAAVGPEIQNYLICRCVPCMARWFALRQPQNRPDTWMSGKAPCPTCRATFCVIDVKRVANVRSLDL